MTHQIVTEIAQAYGITVEELESAYVESHILTRIDAAVKELKIRMEVEQDKIYDNRKEITPLTPQIDPTNTHLVEDFFAKEISKQTSLNIPYRKDI